MSEKTELCKGMKWYINSAPYVEHCPSCTSATERIAELEQQLECVAINSEGVTADDLKFVRMKRDLTAIRTLVGELASLIRERSLSTGNIHFRNEPCNCLRCRESAALQNAKEKGVFPKETD